MKRTFTFFVLLLALMPGCTSARIIPAYTQVAQNQDYTMPDSFTCEAHRVPLREIANYCNGIGCIRALQAEGSFVTVPWDQLYLQTDPPHFLIYFTTRENAEHELIHIPRGPAHAPEQQTRGKER